MFTYIKRHMRAVHTFCKYQYLQMYMCFILRMHAYMHIHVHNRYTPSFLGFTSVI